MKVTIGNLFIVCYIIHLTSRYGFHISWRNIRVAPRGDAGFVCSKQGRRPNQPQIPLLIFKLTSGEFYSYAILREMWAFFRKEGFFQEIRCPDGPAGFNYLAAGRYRKFYTTCMIISTLSASNAGIDV